MAILASGCLPPDKPQQHGTPAPPWPATCPTDPGAAGTLLEACANGIDAVSPDGSRVLVARTPTYDQGLVLISRGGDKTILAPQYAEAWGSFSPDSRSLVFAKGNPGGYDSTLTLARADGSRQRQLSSRTQYYAFGGPWLYYIDESDAGFSFYRLEPPDGAAELIAAFPGPFDKYGPLRGYFSPDGASIAYCIEASPPDCYLLSAGSKTPLKLPNNVSSFPQWAPDGSWLLMGPCQVVDLTGTVRKICDTPRWPFALSPDGRIVAAFDENSTRKDVHLITTSSGTDTILPQPGPVDENVFRPRYQIGFTPDSSRVIAIIAHASFSSPTGGGSWTTLSGDHGAASPSESVWPAISPDSRIIVDYSETLGEMVESIDGASPRPVLSPQGKPVVGPIFEPAGGLDKAIYSDREGAWLANADGTGDWVRLANEGCGWTGRIAICATGHPDLLTRYSLDLVAVTDDGKQIVPLARNVITYQVVGRSLFYVASSGGLYVVDGLPAP